MKILITIATGLLVSWLVLLPKDAGAQSKPTSSPESKLSGQEERGKGLYLQKCALCHLPKIQKPKTVPALSPIPPGLLKGASPTKEAAVRQLIMKGTPNMPGFQYGLEPKELDDVIAYMKTL